MNHEAEAQNLAARVAGAADLLDVRLLESKTDLVRLGAEGPYSFTLNIDQGVTHEEGEDHFAVQIDFDLTVTRSDEEDEEPVAKIQCAYGALYDLVDLGDYVPSEGEFQAYAETAATLTLYPYAREFINSMTNRLGLPRLILPTHRLPSPWHPDPADADETENAS